MAHVHNTNQIFLVLQSDLLWI